MKACCRKHKRRFLGRAGSPTPPQITGKKDGAPGGRALPLVSRTGFVALLGCCAAAILLAVLPPVVAADDDRQVDDLIQDLESGSARENEALLRVSHLSEIFKWPGVTNNSANAWSRARAEGYGERILVRPAAGTVIRTVLNVPERGTYRIWLGYVAGVQEQHPVTLTLEGSNRGSFTFGAVSLPDKPALEIERELPVRFDGDRERSTFPASKAIVWEYRDVEVAAGGTSLSLASDDRTALLDALFLSRSRRCVPGGSRVVGEQGTFNRAYCRFRVVTDEQAAAPFALRGSVSYIIPPQARGPFGAELDSVAAEDGGAVLAAGAWSAWLDVTKATTTQGAYVNAGFSVTGKGRAPLQRGSLEVQYAWLPDPGAVSGAVKAPIAAGAAAVLMSAVWERFPTPPCPGPESATGGIFAVRCLQESQRLRTHRDELAAEVQRIPPQDLKDGVMPQRLRFMTLARIPPADYDLALPLLRRTGFNGVYGITPQGKQAYGLHSEDFKPQSEELYELRLKLEQKYGPLLYGFTNGADPDIEAFIRKTDAAQPGFRQLAHWFPLGDEIGPAVDEASVNWVPEQRREFVEYLREAAKGDPAFFGRRAFEAIPFLAQPDAGMGRFDRRVYYHSAVFRWLATARYYGRVTALLRRIYPNALTMANYSPYTVFYYGAGMDHGQNSFALPRQNACTGHWGEDWLPASGVSSIAGIQTESYFASILRCGASLHGQPVGIYLVWKLGELDRKIGLLVANGVKTFNVYYWGPRYFGGGSPESSSHRVDSYAELNRAARALGPADEILAAGEREPARVALLYNRTDEMWNAGSPWVRTDRIYTFLALRHAHLPVDLILEEDLTPERLQPYKVLYLNGVNIRRAALAPLQRWIEQGGILYAVSATAQRDEYDDPLPEAEDLLGAAQAPGGSSRGSPEAYQPLLTAHQPIDTIAFEETPCTPAGTAAVVGVKTVLIPKSGKPVARYADGSCAGVCREIGKGRVLLLGVMPGYLYAHNAPRDADGRPVNYTAARRALVTQTALAACPPTVTHSDPLVEVARFDHATGIAVVFTDMSYKPGTPGVLTVATARKIAAVTGALAGPLKWRREGDALRIECPAPAPLDVVLLR